MIYCLAAPPCQGFSTHRIKDAGKDDPRNQLLLRYYDFVHELNPKVFLVENVSGLLWKRHEGYLNKFLGLAHENGYRVHFCNTINAREYGVPQNRKRVFILGIREDVALDGLTFPPNPTHFSPTSGKKPWRTSSTVFERPPEHIVTRFVWDYYVPKMDMESDEARKFVRSLEFGGTCKGK